MNERRFVGRFRGGVTDIASEYEELAKQDESAARSLHDHGMCRQAAYFAVQAMEKYSRAKIFRLVNATHECYRRRTETHNLDELLTFLVEIICADKLTRSHVTSLLNERVMSGLRFGQLHNDLRYPRYSERDGSYRILEVGSSDAGRALELLDLLKQFLGELDRLRR